jgi:hypothetical protein
VKDDILSKLRQLPQLEEKRFTLNGSNPRVVGVNFERVIYGWASPPKS